MSSLEEIARGLRGVIRCVVDENGQEKLIQNLRILKYFKNDLGIWSTLEKMITMNKYNLEVYFDIC